MVKVMCAGTFDILHKGHIYYLKEAKKYGDKSIVVVARDNTSELIKGKKPVNNEQDRLEAVKALEIMDEAVLGKEGNIFDIVKEIMPDVICLGYDQKVKEGTLKEELEKRKIKSKIIRISSFKPEKYKSSKIIPL